MKDLKKPLFKELEAELKRRGMTNREYGEEIGLSPSGVSIRLNGKTDFTLSEMLKTKRLLNKSLDELFDN